MNKDICFRKVVCKELTEEEKKDLEFFQKRAERMREFIDYSNVGRKKVEYGKTYMIDELMDRIELPMKMTKLEKRRLFSSILTCCEDIQEEVFLKGSDMVYTLNGFLKKNEIKAKSRRYSESLNCKWLPPKYRIVYQPGSRIKTLNKALEKMSYKDIPMEMLKKTKTEVYEELTKDDGPEEG